MSIIQPPPVQPAMAQPSVSPGSPVNITITTAAPVGGSASTSGFALFPMSSASPRQAKDSVKLVSGSRTPLPGKSSPEPLWEQIAASCVGFMLAIMSTVGIATLMLRHHVGKPIFGGLRGTLLHAQEGLRFLAQMSDISKQDHVLESMREISGAMKDFKTMHGKKNVKQLHKNVMDLNRVFDAFRQNGMLEPAMADSLSDMGNNTKDMVNRFQNSWAAWMMGMGRRKG